MVLLRSAPTLLLVIAVLSAGAARAQPRPAPDVAAPGLPPAALQTAADHPATPSLPQVSLQQELELLRRDRPRLGFPIAVTAGGGAVLVGTLALLGSVYAVTGLARVAYGEDDDSERTQLRDLRAPLIIAGIGGVIAGVGVGWLVHRLRERRPYNQRIRELTRAAAQGPLVRW